MNKHDKIGCDVTYTGGCDIIRGNKFEWKVFNDNELIVGKKYNVIDSCCMQYSYIKKDDKIIKDLSGERYLYWKIKDEDGEEIYIWEGFFEENTNL